MSQQQHAKVIGKLVWRMDAANPAGAFVLVGAEKCRVEPAAETHDKGWCESSFDLLSGVQVCETEMDSLPGDLTDGFMRTGE